MSTALARDFTQHDLSQQADDIRAGLLRASAAILTRRESLIKFCEAAWPIVEPGQTFKDNWHLHVLCHKLEQTLGFHEGPKPRKLIINVPPGTAKSLVVNVMFPAWVWAKNARARFFLASYGQHLSMRDNQRCRVLIESQWYQDRWHVVLQDDQNAKGRYNTNVFGWRIATSVAGVGTGEHPDFILIDDPTSATQADSDTEREGVNNWFDQTIAARQGRDPVIIVVMQRLHVRDLCGHLIPRGGWELLSFPMRYEKCSCTPTDKCAYHKADENWPGPNALDQRTTDGELLFPAMYPEEKVKELETNLGADGVAAQLQQRPNRSGGKLFQRSWFKFIERAALPAGIRWCRGWDTAASEGKGDYTAGVKMGLARDGRIFIADVNRGQWSPANVDAQMLASAKLDGRSCMLREEKEPGASGVAAINAHKALFRAFDYAGVNLGQSKVIRAKPFRAQAEAGNVYLVQGSWNDEYLQELADFDGAGLMHDDQVDGTSCAYNALVSEPVKPTGAGIYGSC